MTDADNKQAPGVMEEQLLRAPFTPEQVEALNEYQMGGWMHPFTCGKCRDRYGTDDDDRALVAKPGGWICLTCDYTQDWAHAFMVEGPPDWWSAFKTMGAMPDA